MTVQSEGVADQQGQQIHVDKDSVVDEDSIKEAHVSMRI